MTRKLISSPIASVLAWIGRRFGIEEQLRASEERFRALVESAPDAMLVVDGEGTMVVVNRQTERLFGYSREELLGQPVEMLMPERARKPHECHRAEYSAHTRSRQLGGDFAALRKDGSEFSAEISLSPIESGAGASVACAIRDVSVRKRSENALLESEARFRQIADAMPQIVWSARPDGNLDYYNQRWYEYTGFDFEQSKDWGWRPVMHPDDVNNVEERWRQAYTSERPFEVEVRLRRVPDAVYRWHLARAVPIRDGAGCIERWMGTSTDIDDFKRAQAEIQSLNETLARSIQRQTVRLQASENRFQLLVEGIQDYAILILDPDGRVASWTGAAERIKGYTEKEILGQHFSRFYTPEDIAAGMPERHLQIAAAQGQSAEEGWRVRKDGSRFFANVQITALHDEAGQLRGFSNITRDITERQRAEQELVLTRRRAEEANRAKSDFLAVISHEIRTPMNAILGMAEVLSETPLNPDQKQYVGIFRSAGANLLTLINDLLDLSKIESGHFELEEIGFDLEPLTAQAIDLVMPRALRQGIAISARLDPNAKKRFMGDPTRLRQVLINLLGNAIKFTGAGEVALLVHTSPGELEFAVSDTGIGIPEQKLQTIFDDFAQGSSSTTREYGGTGLGLGISRRIVEKMGGRLSVTSEVGKGSTFRFTVPLKLAPEPVSKLRPDTAAVPSRGSSTERSLRILLAEDSADNRLLVQLYMKDSPHSLTFAEDGKEAVDQIGSAEFDLVIMDLQMPVMDGLTAVRTIREMERQRGRLPVMILALSANARPEDVRTSLEAGCNAHLSKPISKERLLSAVEEYAGVRGKGDESGDESTDEIAKLAPAYIAARRSELPEMRRALEGGDFSGVRRLGHNLKGTGTSYGFPGLSALGAAIEASSADADAVTLEHHLTELARHLAADLH